MSGWTTRLIHGLLEVHLEGRRYHWAMQDLLNKAAPARTLLDIGCLDGENSFDFARALSVPEEGIHGIEISDEFLVKAKKRIKAYKVDLESEPLPLDDCSIDVITCNQVLEHLKNVFNPMAEFERVLKPGGYMAIGLPNLGSLANRILMLFGRQPLCLAFPGPHVRGWTYKNFGDFLRMNPAFEMVHTIGSSLYPLPRPILESGARLLPALSSYSFFLAKKKEHREESVWRGMAGQTDMTTFGTDG